MADDPDISVTFTSTWDVSDTGQRWSRPSGSTCIVKLLAAPEGEWLEFSCRIRFAVRSGKSGEALGLAVSVNRLVVADLVVFSGNEHDIRVSPGPRVRGQFEVDFRAYDPARAECHDSPVARHNDPSPSTAPASPSVSIVSVQGEWVPQPKDYKLALIAAGRVLSASLFSPAVATDAWSNAKALSELLKSAIAARVPFSMIRLGDGEGRLLAYPWLLSERETAGETIGYMFGSEARTSLSQVFGYKGVQHGVLTLQRMLIQAIRNADAIGFPAPVHFVRFLAKPDGPDRQNLLDPVAAMAGALIGGAKYFDHVPMERRFDTYIFSAIQGLQLFPSIIGGIEFIGIVSHTDYTNTIAEKFGIRKYAHHVVPPHKSFMKSDEVHFPDKYEAIIQNISVPFPGAVFLVSAGYLGKVYCDVIKSRGGIAIDIGAVFDGWFGVGRAASPAHQSEFARMRNRLIP